MEQLIIFVVLLSLGYFFGQRAEKKHYASIIAREESMIRLPVTNRKKIDIDAAAIKHCDLVVGNVVVSVDYFKRILAGLRGIFGGNVRSYETLVDRARREAILRMKESCPTADTIINLRLETSSISKGRKNQVGTVEILAYGTAVYLVK